MINFCFGSTRTESLIQDKTKNLEKYITYIIFGEFVRTIYDTIRTLLNHFLKNEDIINEFDDITEFVLDVRKDLYQFSGQKANLMDKLIPAMIKEIKSKISVYKNNKFPIQMAINTIINDFNSLKERDVLSNFSLLKTSFRCLNFQRQLFFNSNRNNVELDRLNCPNCKIKALIHFKTKYSKEMGQFYKNFESLTKKGFTTTEKKKLKKSFEFFMQYKNGDNINGNKRYCWKLADIYIVLEAPNDFIILTTNVRHQQPFANFINKKCEGI